MGIVVVDGLCLAVEAVTAVALALAKKIIETRD